MENKPRKMGRRTVLKTAVAIAAAQMATYGAEAEPLAQPNPAPAGTPSTPPRAEGKKGDFNFLTGEWKISNRRLKSTNPDVWEDFPGEATVYSILQGGGSIEELRVPTRDFMGTGIRLFEVEEKVWSDFWVNARSGVLTTPGTKGVFVDGVGVFEADDMDGETPIKVRGVWDRITPNSCRWYQEISRDGGRTYQGNWYMDWTRA
jgi:hypothetical protein